MQCEKNISLVSEVFAFIFELISPFNSK